MTVSRTLIDELLARGVDDWIYEAELLDIAFRHGVNDRSDRRTVAIGLIVEVVLGGLMEAGTASDDGFEAWSCSPSEAVAWVASEWLARSDPLVVPGEIVWLNSTARGSARGIALLEQG